MKLLLDQGLPRSAASLLQNVGVDAIHTGDIDYTTAEDAAIIEWARQEGRIVVTLDADFHALLAGQLLLCCQDTYAFATFLCLLRNVKLEENTHV